jgi:hypothetical protein
MALSKNTEHLILKCLYVNMYLSEVAHSSYCQIWSILFLFLFPLLNVEFLPVFEVLNQFLICIIEMYLKLITDYEHIFVLFLGRKVGKD